ncbi:hypothetical protein CEK26_010612 [Fusarium fujikuroi]|nr:hypothetical protein CEK26_010612 [Fusarium fujikuroi]
MSHMPRIFSSLQDAIPSISSQFGLSRDFTSNPTVQGFVSHLFSGQGPTAVDIKTTKRLPEPRLEPSPLPTHPPRPAIVADRETVLARANRGMSPAGSMITVWPNPFDRWHMSTAETSCYLPRNTRQHHISCRHTFPFYIYSNTSDFLLNSRHALPLHRNECRTQGFVGSKPGHPASFVPDSVSDLLSLLLQTLAVDSPCRHLFRVFKPAIPSASPKMSRQSFVVPDEDPRWATHSPVAPQWFIPPDLNARPMTFYL